MKPAQQKHRNERCPDLDQKSVFGSTDKSFDFQVLFESFKKDFNLPALAVYVGDGGSAKTQMIG
jgi:hypothetical protein